MLQLPTSKHNLQTKETVVLVPPEDPSRDASLVSPLHLAMSAAASNRKRGHRRTPSWTPDTRLDGLEDGSARLPLIQHDGAVSGSDGFSGSARMDGAQERPSGSLSGDAMDVGLAPRGRGSVRGEGRTIALLFFLYVLQGIPLGLAGSVPMVLQSRGISYKDQALFSFVFWPFSLKLLWAPLVDAVYSRRFGRRKSWLVPTQYLLGCFMLLLARHVDQLLEGPHIMMLTATFFLFEFLAATQDIAVDGWALTMLSKENVGHASTCNSVGQTAGYFLGNVLFLALESPEFCNAYLRFSPQPTGIVTLADFLHFWGVVFLVSTTLVALLKSERPDGHDEQAHAEGVGVLATYRQLLSIVKLPSVRTFAILLLTCKVGFSAADAVTGLKLIEEGVPKAQLALLALPMVPLQIVLPLLISKYTAGPRPLDIMLKAMPYRLLMGLGFALLVWWTPSVKTESGFPSYYYGIILLAYALHQVAVYSMFVAVMAFNARVSDPMIGGTYMTLLNTLSNLGGNWPATLALWMVEPLTSRACAGATGLACDSPSDVQLCVEAGGSCVTTRDGYYVESALCVLLGVLWWLLLGPRMRRLQQLGPSAWQCSRQRP
ncbi:acetyl-coenzyme A transporter 1 isoform X1 [Lampetra fluviatilis]